MITSLVKVATSLILRHLEHNQHSWSLTVPNHHHLPGLVAVHHVGGVIQPRLQVPNYLSTKKKL